jgi:hypothetical protein
VTVALDVAPSSPPLEAYRARLTVRQARASRLARAEATIAWARLVVFVAGAVMAGVVLRTDALHAGWLLLPAATFVGLVLLHDRVIKGRRKAQRTARFYQDGLARIEDRWPAGDGRSERFQDEDHPYATDLDLFGKGSIFERLSSARTVMGEETLAAWLKGPASPPVIRSRQQAVAELGAKLDLREDLAALGMEVRTELHPAALAGWAIAPAPRNTASLRLGLTGARIVAALLGIVITATLLSWIFGEGGALPFVSALLLGVGFVLPLRPVIRPVLASVHRRADELKLLALVLERLEGERFQAPALVALRAALDTSAVGASSALPPSRRIAQLALLVDLLETRRNQLFGLLTAPLLWTTQLALAIESWRRAFGPAVGRWLAAVGEIEALTSLATYAFEHPELPFPTLLEVEEGPYWEGEAVAHPLLSASSRIANDLALGGSATDGDGSAAQRRPRLLLVSGSNMSGKSTLLRTVGVNTVLALAGAPVCARRLTLSPLAIGVTLRVNDSLQEGRSRFYAEITRLRQIVDLTGGPLPVLFLLDELLGGTNSHDRRIGAEAVIRTLLRRNAIGLATTHDLALAEVALALAPLAQNVHFEDELLDGKMRFDYRMRPGVIRKSNALALMRAVGLEVTEGLTLPSAGPR